MQPVVTSCAPEPRMAAVPAAMPAEEVLLRAAMLKRSGGEHWLLHLERHVGSMASPVVLDLGEEALPRLGAEVPSTADAPCGAPRAATPSQASRVATPQPPSSQGSRPATAVRWRRCAPGAMPRACSKVSALRGARRAQMGVPGASRRVAAAKENVWDAGDAHVQRAARGWATGEASTSSVAESEAFWRQCAGGASPPSRRDFLEDDSEGTLGDSRSFIYNEDRHIINKYMNR